MPKRMYHDGRYEQFYNTWQQGISRPHQNVVMTEQKILMPERPQIYMSEQPQIFMPRVIPLLPTEGMPWPERKTAPVTQVSNPLFISDDKLWTLHDLMLHYPLWKKITGNPLVRNESYVMHEVWRWCLRSIARLCAANNRFSITIAPAIFKDNFRVSSRTYEASLIDPIGFPFKDDNLQEILKLLHANEMGVGYAAFAQLILDLTKEYQPSVPVPSDSGEWLGKMFSRNVNALIQQAVVNDPCLLQPYGRLGFTNHADDLFKNVLPAHVGDEALVALSNIVGYDGRFWGDVMLDEPLFLHHYRFANQGSLPPRKSKMLKQQPRQGVLIQLGRAVSGVFRSGLRHSRDSNVKSLKALRGRGRYTIENVIEHQHSKFPKYPGTIIKVMLDNGVYPHLFMHHYFYEHPRSSP